MFRTPRGNQTLTPPPHPHTTYTPRRNAEARPGMGEGGAACAYLEGSHGVILPLLHPPRSVVLHELFFPLLTWRCAVLRGNVPNPMGLCDV